jgi:hypothetical protein
MHAPAAGVAVAEAITRGQIDFLDSDRFDPARFGEGANISKESYVF